MGLARLTGRAGLQEPAQGLNDPLEVWTRCEPGLAEKRPRREHRNPDRVLLPKIFTGSDY
jgi:hypothetical protein